MVNLAFYFGLIILCHCYLFGQTLNQQGNVIRLNWLRLLLFGVVIDNALLLLAAIFGTQQWLATIFPLRWYLHSLILPFATLFLLSVLQQAKIKAVNNKFMPIVFYGFTLLMLSYGVIKELMPLELVHQTFVDNRGLFSEMQRFVSDHKGPPMATIFTNIFMIIWAVVIWKQIRWPWLLCGSAAIFLINGVSASSDYGFLFGNFAEVIFIFSLIKTERFISRNY